MVETHTASPCVKNCSLNDRNICQGCFRSLDEICRWPEIDNQSREAIIRNTLQRRSEHNSQVRLNNGLTSVKPAINK